MTDIQKPDSDDETIVNLQSASLPFSPIVDPHYLYVEDDLMSRKVVNFIFGTVMKQPHFLVFSDTEWLVQRPAEFSPLPNVIFLDIQMKATSGWEILKLLRTMPEYKTARIIALTASFMREEVRKMKEAGFDGGIAKPIDVSVFPGLVERILKGEEVWHVSG